MWTLGVPGVTGVDDRPTDKRYTKRPGRARRAPSRTEIGSRRKSRDLITANVSYRRELLVSRAVVARLVLGGQANS
jgi:hypothetical protein